MSPTRTSIWEPNSNDSSRRDDTDDSDESTAGRLPVLVWILMHLNYKYLQLKYSKSRSDGPDRDQAALRRRGGRVMTDSHREFGIEAGRFALLPLLSLQAGREGLQ